MVHRSDIDTFWKEAVDRVNHLRQLDDCNLVFGANTRGSGHKYEVYPIVSDSEIAYFEGSNGFELPEVYKSYLKNFGAGGAGPYYGVADFRQCVMQNLYPEPFPYNETVDYDEVDDDAPVWDYPGLAFLCTAGCGTDFLIELNGSRPGRIWCDWTQECSTSDGTLIMMYEEWLTKTAVSLERYHHLKSLANQKNWLGRPKKLTFEFLVKEMKCTYKECTKERGFSTIPEDQIQVHFDQTPGIVILDRSKRVLGVTFDNMIQI